MRQVKRRNPCPKTKNFTMRGARSVVGEDKARMRVLAISRGYNSPPQTEARCIAYITRLVREQRTAQHSWVTRMRVVAKPKKALQHSGLRRENRSPQLLAG